MVWNRLMIYECHFNSTYRIIMSRLIYESETWLSETDESP